MRSLNNSGISESRLGSDQMGFNWMQPVGNRQNGSYQSMGNNGAGFFSAASMQSQTPNYNTGNTGFGDFRYGQGSLWNQPAQLPSYSAPQTLQTLQAREGGPYYA